MSPAGTVNPSNPLFTVFTPTYNRAHTLHRVHESLCAQDLRDFEWLIVDDGSTDSTADLVQHWMDEDDMAIRYIWQENAGPQDAMNRGALESRGQLFLLIGSDDSFAAETLSTFNDAWLAIPEAEREKFSGVVCLCQDQHGNLVGDPFPADVFDSDSREMVYVHHVTGEKWGFVRTDIMRRFPFPVSRELRFVPEGIVWQAMAREYKSRFINKRLRTYWSDESGKYEQLTQATDLRPYAAGLAMWHQYTLENDLEYFRADPIRFLKVALNYARFSSLSSVGTVEQGRKLHGVGPKLLWLLMLPIAYLAYLRDLGRARAV